MPPLKIVRDADGNPVKPQEKLSAFFDVPSIPHYQVNRLGEVRTNWYWQNSRKIWYVSKMWRVINPGCRRRSFPSSTNPLG